MNTRTLKDGTIVLEQEDVRILTITTKCPSKWLLIDRETGEAYVPYETEGKNQWKKICLAEWDIENARY